MHTRMLDKPIGRLLHGTYYLMGLLSAGRHLALVR